MRPKTGNNNSTSVERTQPQRSKLYKDLTRAHDRLDQEIETHNPTEQRPETSYQRSKSLNRHNQEFTGLFCQNEDGDQSKKLSSYRYRK